MSLGALHVCSCVGDTWNFLINHYGAKWLIFFVSVKKEKKKQWVQIKDKIIMAKRKDEEKKKDMKKNRKGFIILRHNVKEVLENGGL